MDHRELPPKMRRTVLRGWLDGFKGRTTRRDAGLFGHYYLCGWRDGMKMRGVWTPYGARGWLLSIGLLTRARSGASWKPWVENGGRSQVR